MATSPRSSSSPWRRLLRRGLLPWRAPSAALAAAFAAARPWRRGLRAGAAFGAGASRCRVALARGASSRAPDRAGVLRIALVSSSRFVKFLSAVLEDVARERLLELAQVFHASSRAGRSAFITISPRARNLYATGSLWPARRNASRAVFSSTPCELVHHAAREDLGRPLLDARPCRHPCGPRAASW